LVWLEQERTAELYDRTGLTSVFSGASISWGGKG